LGSAISKVFYVILSAYIPTVAVPFSPLCLHWLIIPPFLMFYPRLKRLFGSKVERLISEAKKWAKNNPAYDSGDFKTQVLSLTQKYRVHLMKRSQQRIRAAVGILTSTGQKSLGDKFRRIVFESGIYMAPLTEERVKKVLGLIASLPEGEADILRFVLNNIILEGEVRPTYLYNFTSSVKAKLTQQLKAYKATRKAKKEISKLFKLLLDEADDVFLVSSAKSLISVRDNPDIKVNKEELQKKIDNIYLKIAINLAKERSKKMGRIPVAAVIYDRHGNIIEKRSRSKVDDLTELDKESASPKYRHAEQTAILEAKKKGKTDWSNYSIAVTMEPCWRCADFIINHGFNSVVYGALDPTPYFMEHGLAKIRASGIEVVEPVDEFFKEANDMLKPFNAKIKGLPLDIFQMTMKEKNIYRAAELKQALTGGTFKEYRRLVERLTSPSDKSLLSQLRMLIGYKIWKERKYSLSRIQWLGRLLTTRLMHIGGILHPKIKPQVYIIDSKLAVSKQSVRWHVNKIRESFDLSKDWYVVVAGDELDAKVLRDKVDHEMKKDPTFSEYGDHRNNILVLSDITEENEPIVLKDYYGVLIAGAELNKEGKLVSVEGTKVQKETMTVDEIGELIYREMKIVYDLLKKLRPSLTVFGGNRVKRGTPAYELGVELGRAMYRMGFVPRTGAGPGIM